MKVTSVSLLALAAVASLAVTGCQRQEKAAEAPPVEAPAPAPPAQAQAPLQAEAPMSSAPAEQQKLLAAGQTIPVCYDNPNCTGSAGWGVDQTTCNTNHPGGSWREASVGPLGGIVYGACHTPPLP